MYRITVLIFFALYYGCATSQPAAPPLVEQTDEIITPEVELQSIVVFREMEAALGSERVQAESNYISRYAIPLEQPEIYLREDPLLPDVPLVTLYFPATADDRVRKLQYQWGGQEGKRYWVQQPQESLKAFQERYAALYAHLTSAYGKPTESTVLEARSLGDVTTWRQSGKWRYGETKVELALSFSEPVPEGGNRGSGLVRYNEVHRIRLTISHGL